MKPPVARKVPYSFSHHGITLEDPYHWLKDPRYPEVEDPEVLAYLRAENAYFESEMKPHQGLIDTLFGELKAREPEEDSSVPYRKRDYLYQWRYEKDAQYRIWRRAPVSDPTDWGVILDEPKLAAKHDYFNLGGLAVSPNARYLAYGVDTSGAERFSLNILDLETKNLLDEPIPDTLGSPVWAADSRNIFYVAVNEQWRPYQVRRHRIGDPIGEDKIVYTEADTSFFVGIGETTSETFILISAGDHVTSEVRYLPTDSPEMNPTLISPRRAGHEYDVDHREGFFYIRSNARHKNFELLRASIAAPEESRWESVIDGSEKHYLTGHMCLRDFVVVEERRHGLDQIRIIEVTGFESIGEHFIEFPEPAYTVGLGVNATYVTDTIRLDYESMVTPDTVYDYQIRDRSLVTRKVRIIPSGYDAGRFRTERITVPARDGANVPVSIVCPLDFPRDGSRPLYLYGYGAYGNAITPHFSSNRLSLMERGFAVAIAHVRGGDDLGYHWYEAGKLDKRKNTFNDFVDIARHLIDAGYTAPKRIVISGGSAGGELMGAVLNQAPDLWGAVAAHVPFVDVLNTMLDASLPLTPLEWPEWGNPIEDPTAFALIRSYSPYDQLREGVYPPMLVTGGLNDPRVTYWEPAKFVAKLRALKTDENWLLLKTNMGAGHGGKSGRFEALREIAEEYVFFLVSLNVETGRCS
ncbi:MAG: S9 family peptidase [Gammaproteobacteria bacterium]|nr:S9 family peptidase [Gammaproteobacteria bacterium]